MTATDAAVRRLMFFVNGNWEQAADRALGVAAPMAFFPFSGWKESFFGDLHAHGRDAIGFYTETESDHEPLVLRFSKIYARNPVLPGNCPLDA